MNQIFVFKTLKRLGTFVSEKEEKMKKTLYEHKTPERRNTYTIMVQNMHTHPRRAEEVVLEQNASRVGGAKVYHIVCQRSAKQHWPSLKFHFIFVIEM